MRILNLYVEKDSFVHKLAPVTKLMNAIKIDVKNLTYKYPFSDKNALENVSFTIYQGESVGIIGRNGAGKSTLCYALSGLIPRFFKGKYHGKISIDGEDIQQLPFEKLVKKVGLILQSPFSQISGAKMTVYEEVAFVLENVGTEREEMVRRIEKVLKQFNLWEKRNDNPFELSGGQLQRLTIASVLALEPEILILDEPTSQLDPQGTTEVFETIKKLKELGMTIIIVEHKYEKLVEYVDKIILLNNGKVFAFDEPEKVFSLSQIDDYEIGKTFQTKICKEYNVRNENGYYPVKFQQAVELLKGVQIKWEV
ncbi:MAG: energy-coupling factor ABC transporter ATP-binding protein [Fervidobacterium sp.]